MILEDIERYILACEYSQNWVLLVFILEYFLAKWHYHVFIIMTNIMLLSLDDCR